MTTSNTNPAGGDRGAQLLVHREILQIVALIAIAVAGFMVTRALAVNNRAVALHDAEALYEDGQRLVGAGRVEAAIASLRRASVRNRSERKYALALASALERHGDTDASRETLLSLREASPEDAQINLALARLAARRQDVTEAWRFYVNALYAPWPAESMNDRREVRFELIDFLLHHDQASRAQSELLAMAAGSPDDVAMHVRIGQLCARAGDAREALNQYERALRLEPTDGTALAGAGTSAFTLGNYVAARRYLRRAPDIGDVPRIREIVDLVLSTDPLARQIGSAERRRRLSASLDYAGQRLQGCNLDGRDASEAAGATTLARETSAAREQVKRSVVLDQDATEAAVDLLNRVEQYVARVCPPLSARDQALALIARAHTTESR